MKKNDWQNSKVIKCTVSLQVADVEIMFLKFAHDNIPCRLKWSMLGRKVLLAFFIVCLSAA